jgi:YggT family protein
MSFVLGLLIFAIEVFIVIVIIRVIFSWVSPYPTNAVTRLVWRITEPVLAPIRRRLPPTAGFDLSPLVVWLAAVILIGLLRTFAR